jgi:hypothetical protein
MTHEILPKHSLYVAELCNDLIAARSIRSGHPIRTPVGVSGAALGRSQQKNRREMLRETLAV